MVVSRPSADYFVVGRREKRREWEEEKKSVEISHSCTKPYHKQKVSKVGIWLLERHNLLPQNTKFSLLVEKMLQELKINTEGLNLKKASSIQRFFTNQCLESRINSSARQVTIWPHYLHEEVRDNRVIFLSFVKSERDALAISNGFFTVFILKNNIPCNKPRTN
jgi:hypothetical protein